MADQENLDQSAEEVFPIKMSLYDIADLFETDRDHGFINAFVELRRGNLSVSTGDFVIYCAKNNRFRLLTYMIGLRYIDRFVKVKENVILRCAASQGNIETIRALLSGGHLTPEDLRVGKNQPLRAASAYGYVEIVRLLLSYDLTLEDVRTWKNYALKRAAAGGHVGVVDLLLSYGIDAEDLRADDSHVLKVAARGAYVSVVKALLNVKDLNARDVEAVVLRPLQGSRKNGEAYELIVEFSKRIF